MNKWAKNARRKIRPLDAPAPPPGLFDPPPPEPVPLRLARTTDPVTSHNGARDVVPRAGSQMALLLTTAFALHPDLTSEEAGVITGLATRTGCCYWHRVSDLAARGYIEATGTQRAASTGSSQAVYAITDKGRAHVRTLIAE